MSRPLMMVVSSLILGLGLVATPLRARNCAVSAAVQLPLQLDGIRLIEWRQHDTDLELRGSPAGGASIVQGQACASSTAGLQRLQITPRREGSTLVLQVGPPPSLLAAFPSGHGYAYQTLQLSLPPSVSLHVSSGAGAVKLSGWGAVQVDSDAGAVQAQAMHGPLQLQVGSGAVQLQGIVGAISLRSESGDVEVQDATSLDVDSLGSAQLSARRIHGEVHIRHLGSGDVQVSDTSAGFELDSAGASDLRLLRIGGPVHIGRIGAGHVLARQVRGNLLIDSLGAVDVDAGQIGGDLRVEQAGSGQIIHQAVSGQVSVPGRP